MDFEEALMDLCSEAAIGNGRVFAIVCDEKAAELIRSKHDGAANRRILTSCGYVDIRVEVLR